MKNAITGRNQTPRRHCRHRKWPPLPHFRSVAESGRARLLRMDRQRPQKKQKRLLGDSAVFFPFFVFLFFPPSHQIPVDHLRGNGLRVWASGASEQCVDGDVPVAEQPEHRAPLQARRFPSISIRSLLPAFIPAVCVAAQWPLRLSVSMSCRW